ncbi:MAG TPA: LLM class flavin-dependent oxidoreductase [Streptosporangiaceae bacterium]|nr:LLM class flavin-dependent oxidoreductase [Streptosporangiaceae bacterium]
MVTLAAIFPPTQPPEGIVAVAAAADAAGLAELWVWEDCFSESGIATATAMLAATSRLTVGIGLLPVPLRNVALTAMELATVSRLFPRAAGRRRRARRAGLDGPGRRQGGIPDRALRSVPGPRRQPAGVSGRLGRGAARPRCGRRIRRSASRPRPSPWP